MRTGSTPVGSPIGRTLRWTKGLARRGERHEQLTSEGREMPDGASSPWVLTGRLPRTRRES
ncbi:hypothetical protein FHS28_000068 [Roseateles terrae]|uniref:Uncharacterized protein n=1 Tax=Roseateles terrae TaxID=431060 RepID=A0ABR6GNH7_9BURK|nr:hypothetical protein [Roseateles terrae]